MVGYLIERITIFGSKTDVKHNAYKQYYISSMSKNWFTTLKNKEAISPFLFGQNEIKCLLVNGITLVPIQCH